MGRFYKALGPLKNKLFIDGVEQNVFGKTVTLTKSSISGLQTDNNGFHSYNTCYVEYDGKLHFFGSSGNGNIYKGVHTDFDGTTWTEHSEYELPKSKNKYLSFGNSRAVVLNNEIHVLGCYFQTDKAKVKHSLHYKWNPTNGWTKVGNMPYDCIDSDVIVFENQIHLFGGSASKSAMKYHRVYNGKKWKSCKNLPYFFKNVYPGLSKITIYEDKILVLFTIELNDQMPKNSSIGKSGDRAFIYDDKKDTFTGDPIIFTSPSCHIFKNPVSEILSLDATDPIYTSLEIKRKSSEKKRSGWIISTAIEWYFELIMSVVNSGNGEPINIVITYFNDTLYVCKYGKTSTAKEVYKINIEG